MKTVNFIDSSKEFGVKINKIVIREHKFDLNTRYSKVFLETDIENYYEELENTAVNMDKWEVLDFHFNIEKKLLTIYV